MDVMIDLETMGVGRNAAVASIGAVIFDPCTVDTPESLGPNQLFYRAFDLCKQPRRAFEPSTIYFWLNQEKEAQEAICEGNGVKFCDPYTILNQFNQWIDKAQVKTAWCLGATFDHGILDSLYNDSNLRNPFHFSKQLCMRTVATVCGLPRPQIETLTAHNALDDAIKQTIWLQQCLKALRES